MADSSTEKTGRDTLYFDVLRFIAISMVILIHVVSGVVNTEYRSSMTELQIKVYFVIKNVLTPGAPIFFMISGALFLDPDRDMPAKKVFGKYLRRIVTALVIFGTGFSFIELVSVNGNIKPSYIVQAFELMLKGQTWAHMWYMYALAVLYLLVPIIRWLTAKAGKTAWIWIMVVMFIITSVLPTVLGVNNIFVPRYGIYLFYFMAGHFFHKYVDGAKPTVMALISVMLAVLVGVISFMFTGETELGNSIFCVDYAAPLIVIYSVSIFVWLGSAGAEVSFMTKLRARYFAVYLVHTFFINLAYKFLGITPLLLGGYVLIPVFFAVTFGLSLISSWILSKIPVINKYVV